MVLLVLSTLPRAPYGAAASTSSPTPLSIHPRPRRHPLAVARCSARLTPPPTAAATGREAAASWAGKLAGAVPWKAAVSSALALTLSFSCCQENRLRQEIEDLEKDTGYKLRVLAQNYPDTPGLAIKDFWQVDDRTIVFVADPTFGNIINFNIGSLIDLDIPQSFWSRVAGKYGNMFYWKEKGEDASIEGAVMAISRCLREPTGASNCSEVF
ncbi:hypothetical protein CFC21_008182 [Triticum aestivum]|uniref:TPM domain-containing protein n=2 Tax=Triticum aestivum TaxID=4565 RepID=A0A9R1DFW1_WHEAT|nr:hypothetical protein CFC21_008182 [Triticum aestivum]